MTGPIGFEPAIPMLTVVDEALARSPYVEYLGFNRDWGSRPGLQRNPWGRTLTATDPSNNHLNFTEAAHDSR